MAGILTTLQRVKIAEPIQWGKINLWVNRGYKIWALAMLLHPVDFWMFAPTENSDFISSLIWLPLSFLMAKSLRTENSGLPCRIGDT